MDHQYKSEKKGAGFLLAVFLLLLICSSTVSGWSRRSHNQMAYWAAYYRGWTKNLPGSPFAHTPLHVKWEAEIDFMLFQVAAPDQEVDQTITLQWLQQENSDAPAYAKWTPLEILTIWSSIPDPVDEPTAIAKGGLIAHMYTPTYIGYADQMCQNYFDQAVQTYPKDKGKALALLGMAIHYMEDMGIPIHCEADYLNPKQMSWQILSHTTSESWVDKHWQLYFDDVAEAAGKNPIPICDVSSAARSLALASYWDLETWKSTWGHYAQNPQVPEKEKEFIKVVRQCVKRTVPRIAGLIDLFAKEAGIKK